MHNLQLYQISLTNVCTLADLYIFGALTKSFVAYHDCEVDWLLARPISVQTFLPDFLKRASTFDARFGRQNVTKMQQERYIRTKEIYAHGRTYPVRKNIPAETMGVKIISPRVTLLRL